MADPTQLTLGGKAEYIEDGDTVLVVLYVTDPTQELGYPNYVKEGRVALIHSGVEVARIEFDRKFGNGPTGEGDFVFQFSHPTSRMNNNIDVHVLTYPVNGSTLTLDHQISVDLVAPAFLPLSPQSDDIGEDIGELRSSKRLNEEL